MTPGWWRVGAACALAIWLSLAGYWLKGLVEEAGQANMLRDQIKANSEAQEHISTIATEAEKKLAEDRKKAAEINRKWNTIRADKARAVCALDDDTIRLLREATSP